jgi:hypothetical protein
VAPPAPLSERRVRGHKLARGVGSACGRRHQSTARAWSAPETKSRTRGRPSTLWDLATPTVSIARLLEFVMLASVVALRASVVPISYGEKEVISRDRDLAQLFIGVGSPVVWTAFLLISIWLWS